MSNTETVTAPKPRPWVRLHLAKQADSCAMPRFIVGVLHNETPTSYILSNVVEIHQSTLHERQFMDYVSRTYVYRVEILGGKPDLLDLYEDSEPMGYGNDAMGIGMG